MNDHRLIFSANCAPRERFEFDASSFYRVYLHDYTPVRARELLARSFGFREIERSRHWPDFSWNRSPLFSFRLRRGSILLRYPFNCSKNFFHALATGCAVARAMRKYYDRVPVSVFLFSRRYSSSSTGRKLGQRWAFRVSASLNRDSMFLLYYENLYQFQFDLTA